MAQRIESVGDLWSDLLKTKRSLRVPIERLSKRWNSKTLLLELQNRT